MEPELIPLDGPDLTTLLTVDDVRPEDRGAFLSMKKFDERIARVLREHGEVICPRCHRPARGWPLKRPNNCGSDDSVFCFRDPEVILAARKDGA